MGGWTGLGKDTIQWNGTIQAADFSLSGTPLGTYIQSLISQVIPSGMIMMWKGTIATIPTGWALCDGNNGTVDLRNKVLVPADQDDAGTPKTTIAGSALATGGASTHTHSIAGFNTNYSTTGVTINNNTTGISASDSGHTHTMGSSYTDTGYASISVSDTGHSHSVSSSSGSDMDNSGSGSYINYISGADSTTTGITASDSGHTHSLTMASADTGYASISISDGGHNHGITEPNSSTGHRHSINLITVPAGSTIPPFKAVVFIQKL